ncbi:MAG: hypothetical protein ACRYGB_12250 [Janthinobacterium lividum]
MNHTFHIPVLGLGYSVDTPLKVARFGISSVVSIVDDELAERMRKFHAEKNEEAYIPISKNEEDSRAKRITAYLNLLNRLVKQQIADLKQQKFIVGTALSQYFEMLPETSALKAKYALMLDLPESAEKLFLQAQLRNGVEAGTIDVNIMSKVDKANYSANGDYLGEEYTDALAALRGFAASDLQSSVVISAGLNPRLYAYLENLHQFYPDKNSITHKRVILKVSDFRSAQIQAKVLAKKGIWVYEFRIESGLNCGGHAFATEGFLLGPILEDFKQKRKQLAVELFDIYAAALSQKSIVVDAIPEQRITAQGGIGTAEEDRFLTDFYQLDATGWGSPFLLVPEVTNVDAATLNDLATAGENEFYISNSSPLGVLFNNFRKSSAEKQRLERIEAGRPGSPCTKKYLCTNTEFTEQPICTASRQYQNLKLKQLQTLDLPPQQYQQQADAVTVKVCLCEGLCTSTYLKNDLLKSKESVAVAICPGPNLAYFTSSYSLVEMVDHIYNRRNLLGSINRPNLFINELSLYIGYLKNDIAAHVNQLNDKKAKYFVKFRDQLLNGINYYTELLPQLNLNNGNEEMFNQLLKAKEELALCL